MVCAGSSGQVQVIGADWGGCWVYPWIHLRQKEARQWEYMNEWGRMSQLLCANLWNAVNYLKASLGKEKRVQKSVEEEVSKPTGKGFNTTMEKYQTAGNSHEFRV